MVFKTALFLALLLQICDGNGVDYCSERREVCSLDCFLRQQCRVPAIFAPMTLQQRLRRHWRRRKSGVRGFLRKGSTRFQNTKFVIQTICRWLWLQWHCTGGDWQKCHYSGLPLYPITFSIKRSFLGPNNGRCKVTAVTISEALCIHLMQILFQEVAWCSSWINKLLQRASVIVTVVTVKIAYRDSL